LSKLRRALARGALVASLLLSPSARAQTDAAQRENAQALYKAGNDARDAGDMKTAADKYKVAYALVQTPVIAVALGKAHVALGQLIEARQVLLGAGNIPVKPHESALTTSARAEAATLAAQIEPRIPSVTLKVATPEGSPTPIVTIDGVTIPEGALNAPWKVNPGAHVAVATLEGAQTERQFSVAEAETRDIPLDAPAASGAAIPPATGVELPKSQLSVPPPRATAPTYRPSRIPAYVALGVGGAGVVVTAVFGVLALNDKSALNRACTPEKTDCPQPDVSALQRDSIASDVGLGVAVAGAVVGGALLLFRRGTPDTSPTPDKVGRVHVEPWVSVGGLGMTGSF